MYKADIISKNISNGLLSIDVSFYSDEDSFIDRFETNQYQNEFWIGEQIERRLKHLNSLAAIKDAIVIGSYQRKEDIPKSDKEIYQGKKLQYLNYMNEARLGVIKYDRPVIKELLDWLRENFKDEYLS